MEEGFVKADSNNLPKISSSMIDEFYMANLDFLSAETRNVKSKRSARESYGDSAIGYVQIKRDGAICTVKGKITPEHKVHAKYYLVNAAINEVEETILSGQCVSCTASSGGCKHGVAFLFWLHRRSEESAVTSTTCYWKAPTLSKAGRGIKHMDLASLANRPIPELKVEGQAFLNVVVQEMSSADATLLHVFNPVKNGNCLVFQLLLKCKRHVNISSRNAEDFLDFMKERMSQKDCDEAELSSRQQKDCREWFELRFGRITASKIYEASRCKTADGSLTEVILGASTFEGTPATKRGQRLESEVLKEVSRIKGIRITTCGLILNPNYPIFGASPDGMSKDYVVEVKCPSKIGTVGQYVEDNVIKPRFQAQLQMQMLFAQKQTGLFCVASPSFEQNREVQMYEVALQTEICEDLMDAGTNFWKTAIYPLLSK